MRGGVTANLKHFPVLADSDYTLHILNRQLPPRNIYLAALNNMWPKGRGRIIVVPNTSQFVAFSMNKQSTHHK